ncbi:hypothetical protein GCM10009733_020210 [Nonomuraea maheshkhaliensis]|uniref:Uncharacterized protein n=1 Tax=Nonomuraea maheshkhaliensis TaxID=419590 RepID=A0ABN2F231_9ACTN
MLGAGPLTVTDAQWQRLLAQESVAGFRINRIDDVRAVLKFARCTLSDLPRDDPCYLPDLLDVEVYDTSVENDQTFTVRASAVGWLFNAHTFRISLAAEQRWNDRPGKVVVWAVLSDILARYNSLVDAVAAFAARYTMAEYAKHLGLAPGEVEALPGNDDLPPGWTPLDVANQIRRSPHLSDLDRVCMFLERITGRRTLPPVIPSTEKLSTFPKAAKYLGEAVSAPSDRPRTDDPSVKATNRESVMDALRRRLAGHTVEFDDEHNAATIIYDYGHLTIVVDDQGRCGVTRDTPDEANVSHGDGLMLDALGPVLYRALCEAVEEAER